MTVTQATFVAATVLAGLGLWLMLPSPARDADRRRWLGVGLSCVALGLFAAELSPLGHWLADGQFGVLALVTVVGAVGSITMRSPVYCALWFALSLMGTAGLFLCQGAQFLGVATIVVYAGAILVTFLFVLMLAQPKGKAFSDRLSFDAPLSAATGALLIGILTMTLTTLLRPDDGAKRPVPTETDSQRQSEILNPDHMAHLGGELFSRDLIAVEVAGTLLLIALVGTVAIVGQLRDAAPGEKHRMDETALLHNYLMVGAVLFGIGLIGFLSRRNMIVMFLAAEMMLQGVSVSLVAWSRYHNDWGGQMLVIFILTVAACEAGIALAMIVTLFQRSGSLDVIVWQQSREESQPQYVDREVPEDEERPQQWPHLTPAGVRPEVDEEETLHRGNV